MSPVIRHWTAALLFGILSIEVSLWVFPDGKRCCHKKQNFRETKAAILSRRKYQGYQTKFSNTILAYITEFPSFQRSKYVVTKMSISFAMIPATFSINPLIFLNRDHLDDYPGIHPFILHQRAAFHIPEIIMYAYCPNLVQYATYSFASLEIIIMITAIGT